MRRLFSTRALVRSLKISGAIAVVYFMISLALIFWPSTEPFAATRHDQFESFVSANSSGETVIVPGLTHDGILDDPTMYRIVEEWYKKLP